MEDKLGDSIMHICGKTSTALQNMGFIEVHPIKFEENVSYGYAIDYILENRKDINIIGHNCIKKTPPLELKKLHSLVYRIFETVRTICLPYLNKKKKA